MFRCDTCSLSVKLLSGEMSDTRGQHVAPPCVLLFFHNIFHPLSHCNKFKKTGEEQETRAGQAERRPRGGGVRETGLLCVTAVVIEFFL